MMPKLLCAWVGCVCLLAATSVFAQQADAGGAVPRLVKFSGVVKDRRGEALTAGVVTLSFSIYASQEGGTALWAEKQAVELDEQGRYTVLLGATHSAGLSLELFPSGQARWLAVTVEGGEEQARVLLVSVPYALKAEEAEMLGGKRASDFVLAEKLKEEVKTAVAVEVQQVGEKSSEQVASEKGPQPLTGAEGPTDFTGSNSTQIVSATQTGTGKAIYALIQNAASGAQAVRGETNGTSGRAVFGYATATTGTAIGVRGQSDSPTGIGVAGYLSAPTGYNYALSGISASAQGRGVLAQATSTTGTTIGFLAQVSSPSGVAGTFRNTASGKIITGEVGAGPVTQVFSVDGSGNIVGAGTHTGTRLISTVTTGTAPLTVASTTAVSNLNADLLDGLHAAAFAPATGSVVYVAKAGDTMAGTLNLPANGLNVGTYQLDVSNGGVGVGNTGQADAKLFVDRSGTDNSSNLGLWVSNSTTSASPAGTKYGAKVQLTGEFPQVNSAMDIYNGATNSTSDGRDKYGLYILSSGSFLGGGGQATRNFGLFVLTPSGADQNYAASFGGKVGINTTSPAEMLDVNGNIYSNGTVTASSFSGPLTGTASDLNCSGCVSASEVAANVATQVELDAEGTARAAADTTLQTNINGKVSTSGDIMVGTLYLPQNGLVVGNDQLIVSSGKVGIGTSTPAQTLDVVGNIQATAGSGGAVLGFATTNTANGVLALQGSGVLSSVLKGGLYAETYITDGNGLIGVANTGTNAWAVYGESSSGYAGYFSGKVYVTGKLTAVGGFNGQCLSSGQFNTSTGNSCNMDLAEGFASAERTEPGDLVSLDTHAAAGPGVHKSAQAYESLLAGVVSANPGLVFEDGRTHLSGDNSQLISKDRTVVALAGRVLTKVSLENGPVSVGDPITSSSAPGIGMKASKTGKIVGYALEPAEKDSLILVLVQPGYYVAPDGNAPSRPSVNNRERKEVDATTVDYARLTALLIEAVKEQQTQIREQQAQIRELKGKIEQVQAQMNHGVMRGGR